MAVMVKVLPFHDELAIPPLVKEKVAKSALLRLEPKVIVLPKLKLLIVSNALGVVVYAPKLMVLALA